MGQTVEERRITIDELIEILIDEYMSANILKDEKKHYDLILDLYKLKE